LISWGTQSYNVTEIKKLQGRGGNLRWSACLDAPPIFLRSGR